MNHRTGVDDVEKKKFLTPLGLEVRHLGSPERSQSLYRLRYPDSFYIGTILYVKFYIYIYIYIYIFMLENIKEYH
jgi:hypothetical protein